MTSVLTIRLPEFFPAQLRRKSLSGRTGKKVPVQRFGDFKEDQITTSGMVWFCMKGASVFGDVRGIFPEEIVQSLEDGITAMDHKIHGFADNDALLSGVESRTSSPVRIERDENFVCASVTGSIHVVKGPDMPVESLPQRWTE